jgi:hypothetical protein
MSETFTPKAEKLWKKVPSQIKPKLLSSVWCGQCVAMTTIIDYRGEVKGNDLVLTGFCKTCGSEVTRLLESE